MITPLNASFSFAAAGDNTAIAAVSGVNLRIWRVVISNGVATAQSILFKDGTAGTALTGVMPLQTAIGPPFVYGEGNMPLFILTSGNAFVINLLNATNVAGFISYTLA